ncbi:MAG: hypothetical protein R3Y12_09145 [Clostridia bacterium]
MLNKSKKLFPKKFVIIVLTLNLSFILMISLFVLFKAPKISEEANGEFYEVLNVQVPTITAVIDKYRKATKMSVVDSETSPYKSFTYTELSSVEIDIETYIDYLIEEANFELKQEENANSVLWTAVLTKYDNDKTIIVDIKCNVSEYTIKVGLIS